MGPLRIALAVGVVGLFIAMAATPKSPSPAPEAPKQPAVKPEDPEEAEHRRSVIAARRVKASMKNPDSFKLENGLRTASGTLCLTYRATNSYSAIVPGRAVVIGDKITVSDNSVDFANHWNRHCAGKPASDVTYIRAAI